MGTDINGFIERARDRGPGDGAPRSWRRVMDLADIAPQRDYDAFGCLFGVMNFANFRPVAADRGLPADASDAVRTAHDADLAYGPDQAFGTTWATWAELDAIDWHEPAEAVDSRVHEFTRVDGKLRAIGKAAWSRAVARSLGLDPGDPDAVRRGYADLLPAEESEWEHEGTVFRTVRLHRRDAVPPLSAWQPLWDVMRALADVHGEHDVRMVVWFDR